jgi:hypothetical protein
MTYDAWQKELTLVQAMDNDSVARVDPLNPDVAKAEQSKEEQRGAKRSLPNLPTMGIALYVDWNAYRPAFSVRKVCLEDATLTTIYILFIQDWDFAVRSESRDGGR